VRENDGKPNADFPEAGFLFYDALSAADESAWLSERELVLLYR
jgi:hypothetical protein